LFELQPVKQEIFIAGFHSIYYFEFGKHFSHPPERHNFWEMVYVDKGSAVAFSGANGYTLTQGQVIFHEPDEIHAHTSDQKVANNMLVISFTAAGDAMHLLSKKSFTLDKTSKTLLSLFIVEAEHALGQLPSRYEDKRNLDFCNAPFGATQLLQCYFTEFLLRLIRNSAAFGKQIHATEQSRAIAANSLTEMIAEFMEQSVYRPLTLPDLCTHFMMGKSQLSKIFKENTGKSPMEYYTDLKLAEAKKLLREEKLSVSEISDLLGYSSVHNFSRAFKKAVHFSPTAYQKSIL